MNVVIRAAAAATGTQFIDLGKALLEVCPSRKCDDLFSPDNHPTAKGHALAARAIVQELEAPAVPSK